MDSSCCNGVIVACNALSGSWCTSWIPQDGAWGLSCHAAGEWWCGDAKTYQALEPEQFQRDIKVIVAVVATAGMVLEMHKVVEEQSHPGWVFAIRGDLEPPTWLEIIDEMSVA